MSNRAMRDLRAIVGLLDVEPLVVRKSAYRGFEIVLAWAPEYHAITVLGLGSLGKIMLYSRRPFAGASKPFERWVLEL
jgi:hypothetical protein